MKRRARVSGRLGPKRGSRRVASWIYLTINPLLEALDVEEAFLSKENPTFRRSPRELEFIRPVREHLGHGGPHVLDDFIAANPASAEELRRRDEERDRLEREAQKVFEALICSGPFRDRVNAALSDYEKAHRDREFPGGAVPRELFHEVVGELLVNDAREVAPHWTSAFFWDGYQDRFEAFRRGRVAPGFARILREFGQANSELRSELRILRSRFCSEFDLSAFPLARDESFPRPRR